MADDPTNTTSSASIDIPQATLSNATNTPTTNNIETAINGNIKFESSGGKLVMEEFNHSNNSSDDKNNVAVPAIIINSNGTDDRTQNPATPQNGTTSTTTPKNSTKDIPLKTPSSSTATTATTTPSQPKSIQATISPKVPRYLIKSTNGRATYITMVHEAIVELADRTGSSIPAIQKFMKNKHDHLNNVKPKLFNNSVNSAIKTGLKEERFVKIRNSYKMNSAWVRKQKDAFRAREARKKAAEKKRKVEAEKIKAEKEKKIKAEKAEREKKLKEEREKAKIVVQTADEIAAAEKRVRRNVVLCTHCLEYVSKTNHLTKYSISILFYFHKIMIVETRSH